MSKSKNISLSYLLTVGVVSFTRYSLLPWCLWNLHARKYSSWTKAVPAYGFLLSSLQAGHAVGQLLVNLNFTNSSLYSIAFFLLTGSYVNLCFVDRYSLQLVLFFFLGFSGSLLSGVSINLDKSASNISFVRKPNDVELNNNTERVIKCFVFSTLISGYLYDASPFSRFPILKVAILIGSVCFLVCIYFVCINRIVNRKWKSNNKQSAQFSNNTVAAPSITDGQAPKSISAAIKYTGKVPLNFLSCCNNDLSKAQAMYGKRIQWRIEQNIDTILTTPQFGFQNVLKYYPHAIHGYSLDGCAVVYEILGKGNPSALIASGVAMPVSRVPLSNILYFDSFCDCTALILVYLYFVVLMF